MTSNPDKADSSPQRVRDFLYVDVPRLRSLYAQMFQSITEDVIKESIQEELSGETTAVIEKRETIEREEIGARASRFTERGILHDHMYNMLEERITSIISDVSSLTEIEEIKSRLEMPFIRVQGQMEVEDLNRVREHIEKFNRFGEVISYGEFTSDKVQEERDELESQKKNRTLNASERKIIGDRIKVLKELKIFAASKGLYKDEQLLNNLQFAIDLFEKDAYHVIIASNPQASIRYRGVADTQFLRVTPQRFRQLYGNQSNAVWVMVGTVTFIPKTFSKWSNPEGSDSEPDVPVNEASGMTSLIDALRGITRSTRAYEQAFLESAKTFEVVILPLAIYREFPLLPSRND